MLKSIDKEWRKHLQDLEALKRNEYLKAYGNMDPVTQYRLDAYPLFAEMVVRVKKGIHERNFKRIINFYPTHRIFLWWVGLFKIIPSKN